WVTGVGRGELLLGEPLLGGGGGEHEGLPDNEQPQLEREPADHVPRAHVRPVCPAPCGSPGVLLSQGLLPGATGQGGLAAPLCLWGWDPYPFGIGLCCCRHWCAQALPGSLGSRRPGPRARGGKCWCLWHNGDDNPGPDCCCGRCHRRLSGWQ
ncbi:unnamed protein product, partial [Discosporangium mesarthrocarpum]